MFIYVRHAFSKANQYHFTVQKYGKENIDDHMDHPYFTRDAQLTDIGHEQSAASGKAFKAWLDDQDDDVVIDKVVISPMMRTIETASAFLREVGYQGEVTLDPILREIMDVNIADMGTEKTPLLERIRNSSNLLTGLTINESELTKEVWFSETPESKAGFNARIEAIRDKYVRPTENDPKKITLVFSHHVVGRGLRGTEEPINNTQIERIKADGSSQTLYKPAPAPI